MTMIADLLDRDPRGQRLGNNGQARLIGTDEEARGELRTFVCGGRLADGVSRPPSPCPAVSSNDPVTQCCPLFSGQPGSPLTLVRHPSACGSKTRAS